MQKLSDREFEVFQLIGQGVGTRNIAKQLHLSVKTVEVHRANIKGKLGINTATGLLRYAVRWVDSQGRKLTVVLRCLLVAFFVPS